MPTDETMARLEELLELHKWLMKAENRGITRSDLFRYVDERMTKVNPPKEQV